MRRYFHRHLVCRTTDPSRFNLNLGGHTSHRLIKHFQRISLRPLLNEIEAVIHNPLGGALLATIHHPVDEHLYGDAVVAKVRIYLSSFRSISSWHLFFSADLITSALLLRIWNAPAFDYQHHRHPVCLGRCDNEHREDPLHDPREPKPQSGPGASVLRQEYRQ